MLIKFPYKGKVIFFKIHSHVKTSTMKVTIAALLMGTFASFKATPVLPTKRPETPVYDDDKHRDPFFHKREHPIDNVTWSLWNRNPNRPYPWWEQHR